MVNILHRFCRNINIILKISDISIDCKVLILHFTFKLLQMLIQKQPRINNLLPNGRLPLTTVRATT